MIGMVLAAGAGRRLRPYTDTLPKALVPVDGETTILDIGLRNLAAVGLTDVTVVVGYRAEAVEARQADLEQKHGVRITLVHNDKAEEWNNATPSGWRGSTSRRVPCSSTATPCTRSTSSRPCSAAADNPTAPVCCWRWTGSRSSPRRR